MKKIIPLLTLLLIGLACEKSYENKIVNNDNEANFCSIFNSPERYESKVFQTKAIVLGFHTFIFYNSQCLEQNKVLALEMSYESRQKIGEVISSNKINYKTDFLNNNFYAEINVLGELKKNDENEKDVFRPKYKFFVNEIKDISILSEEIYPSEEARGEKNVKQ